MAPQKSRLGEGRADSASAGGISSRNCFRASRGIVGKVRMLNFHKPIENDDKNARSCQISFQQLMFTSALSNCAPYDWRLHQCLMMEAQYNTAARGNRKGLGLWSLTLRGSSIGFTSGSNGGNPSRTTSACSFTKAYATLILSTSTCDKCLHYMHMIRVRLQTTAANGM
jgi:hypothetical protein